MSRPSPAAPPIRAIALLAKSGLEGTQALREVTRWLAQRGIAVRCEAPVAEAIGEPSGFPRREIPADSDLVVVVGGDGTFLSAARSAVPLGIPLLGVNYGSLGFLTEVQPDELYGALERVLAGQHSIEERWALQVDHLREDRPLHRHVLLNDAVVTKSALARIIRIHLQIDGQMVADYTSDGLILSTATGSTAYNLSAGGPILDPRISAFVVAPICPHTMNQRPLVVPGDARLEVTVGTPSETVYLTLDGQLGFPFEGGDRLIVTQHPCPARLVRVADRGFYHVLRRKLRWGER